MKHKLLYKDLHFNDYVCECGMEFNNLSKFKRHLKRGNNEKV